MGFYAQSKVESQSQLPKIEDQLQQLNSLTSDIWRLTSGAWHLTSDICYPSFSRLVFDLYLLSLRIVLSVKRILPK